MIPSDISNVSAILLARIRQLANIRSWRWSTISRFDSYSDWCILSLKISTPEVVTSSCLNMTGMCHLMFTSSPGWFPLEFSSARTASSILENSILSVDIGQLIIWNKFKKNNRKDPENKQFLQYEKNSLSSYSDKITLSFGKICWVEDV